MDEGLLLLRALRDCNMPKFLADGILCLFIFFLIFFKFFYFYKEITNHDYM